MGCIRSTFWVESEVLTLDNRAKGEGHRPMSSRHTDSDHPECVGVYSVTYYFIKQSSDRHFKTYLCE